ncbi:MAG: hypothetical protein Q4B77_04265 [Coriobacteriaceae bacterium]|nr:hypothetical protein [Coriobacteriaceae bacterium]
MKLQASHVLHPAWTFCLYSAAIAHGLQVPRPLLSPIHVSIAPTHSRRRQSGCVACHICKGDSRVLSDGIPCTDLLQTLLDCLCAAGFRHGLAIVDSALHFRLTTVEELTAYFDAHGKGRRGIQQARKTLSYADGRSDNGDESIVRAIIIELGFEVPDLQVEVEDPLHPGIMKRADMGWTLPDGQVVLAELDGLSKYLATEKEATNGGVEHVVQVMRAERLRESHLNLTGATVLRFSFAQALDTEYLFNLLTAAGVPLRGVRR